MPEPTMNHETRKSDDSKVKYQYIMRDLAKQLERMAHITTRGAVRYDEKSWQLSTKPIAYLDAAYRHIAAWNMGERMDQDSCQPHLLHACINLMYLDFFDDKKLDSPEDSA